MKIETSYEVRGKRIGRYFSYPEPTAKDLTNILGYVSWVASQQAPEIHIESTI